MSEEQNAIDTSEQVSVEETSTSETENVSPALEAEKQLDEKVKKAIGIQNLPADGELPAEDSEESKDTKEPEKKEEEVSGNEEEKNAAKPAESSQEQASHPGKFDRRLAKLYLQIELLKGNDGELPDIESAAAEISKFPFVKKKEALTKLLSEKKTLLGGQDDGSTELSPEDHEALVEAQAEQMFNEMQGEIKQKEWQTDLVETVESHPELDERKEQYNPTLASAVEKLAMGGMKVSEAYALVTNSVASVQGERAEKEKVNATLTKEKALSGAVSATHDSVTPKGKLTWEDVAKIQEENPAEYQRLVREDKLPKD